MVWEKAIKKILYQLAYYSQYQRWIAHRIKRQNVVPILSFHRISPQVDYCWPPMHPNVFSSLISHLKKNYQFVSLHELAYITSGKPKIVLSFDDGYYDFIEYAMPILHKNRIKVNQNIILSTLFDRKPLWNIELYDFLYAAPISLINEIILPLFGIKISEKNTKTCVKIALRLSQYMKHKNHYECEKTYQKWQQIFCQAEPFPRTRMIALNEIPQLMSEHEIGVHSYSHYSMGQETMEYFIDDFSRCCLSYQVQGWQPFDIYAFPNGSYRQEQIDFLKKQGIEHILLVNDQYASEKSPYCRFHIAASTEYEAIFQALGIKARWKKSSFAKQA